MFKQKNDARKLIAKKYDRKKIQTTRSTST